MFLQILFWIVVAIVFIACIARVEDDDERGRLGYVSTVLVIFLVIAFFLDRAFVTGLWTGVSSDWSATIFRSLAYLLLGLGWSFFKWWQFAKKMHRRYTDLLNQAKATKDNDLKNYPDKGDEIKRKFKSRSDELYLLYKPVAKQNKEQISSWIIFWPFSVLRYIIGRALVDALNWIVDQFGGVYNRITNSLFPKFTNDDIQND